MPVLIAHGTGTECRCSGSPLAVALGGFKGWSTGHRGGVSVGSLVVAAHSVLQLGCGCRWFIGHRRCGVDMGASGIVGADFEGIRCIAWMLITFAPIHEHMIATLLKLDHIDPVAGCDPLEPFGFGEVMTAVQRLRSSHSQPRTHPIGLLPVISVLESTSNEPLTGERSGQHRAPPSQSALGVCGMAALDPI